jgi:hypothetical protein
MAKSLLAELWKLHDPLGGPPTARAEMERDCRAAHQRRRLQHRLDRPIPRPWPRQWPPESGRRAHTHAESLWSRTRNRPPLPARAVRLAPYSSIRIIWIAGPSTIVSHSLQRGAIYIIPEMNLPRDLRAAGRLALAMAGDSILTRSIPLFWTLSGGCVPHAPSYRIRTRQASRY